MGHAAWDDAYALGDSPPCRLEHAGRYRFGYGVDGYAVHHGFRCSGLPKLKFGNTQNQVVWGQVGSKFGYEYGYANNVCKTPISNVTDHDNYGPTCMTITYSGAAYNNYAQYLANWTDIANAKNGSLDIADRPPPVGMLYDNTTVQGAWLEQEQNMTEVSKKFGRIVNNVTMAMPLSAVFGAAKDARNDILQPQDLDGLGEFFWRPLCLRRLSTYSVLA